MGRYVAPATKTRMNWYRIFDRFRWKSRQNIFEMFPQVCHRLRSVFRFLGKASQHEQLDFPWHREIVSRRSRWVMEMGVDMAHRGICSER